MIPVAVFTVYVALGLAFGIPMAVYGNDPGGAVVLGIFMPFAVGMFLLALFLIVVMIGEFR